jgi:hypothetical protein
MLMSAASKFVDRPLRRIGIAFMLAVVIHGLIAAGAIQLTRAYGYAPAAASVKPVPIPRTVSGDYPAVQVDLFSPESSYSASEEVDFSWRSPAWEDGTVSPPPWSPQGVWPRSSISTGHVPVEPRR